MSYGIPLLINYNWGLNSEENSMFITGFYFGGGYGISNVVSSKAPYYDPVHGIVIDAGIRMDGSPVSHVGATYTIGLDGKSNVYSFAFFYDF